MVLIIQCCDVTYFFEVLSLRSSMVNISRCLRLFPLLLIDHLSLLFKHVSLLVGVYSWINLRRQISAHFLWSFDYGVVRFHWTHNSWLKTTNWWLMKDNLWDLSSSYQNGPQSMDHSSFVFLKPKNSYCSSTWINYLGFWKLPSFQFLNRCYFRVQIGVLYVVGMQSAWR